MVEDSKDTRSDNERAKKILLRVFRHESTVLGLVLAAVIGVVALITRGVSVSRTNIVNTLMQTSIRGVAAVGQTFVILTAGIDLSVGGVGLFGSVIGASVMTTSLRQNIAGETLPIGIGIFLILLATAGLGTLNGLSVSRVGLPPLIATLAMWQIAKGLGFKICHGLTIHRLPDSLSFWGSGIIGGFPVAAIVFVVVAVVSYFVLEYTRYGRSIFAVGGNPTSAWLSGLNVKNTTMSAYIVSGLLAGIAGVIFTGRILCASMETLTNLEIDSIIGASLGGVSLAGGKGNIISVVIGVLILGVINNALSLMGASPAIQGIAKGTIIFAAVTVDVVRRNR